jgi:hypothetical protein
MEKGPDDLQLLSERYYELVWKHYMFQVSCITREDYGRMQALIPGYTEESYDQHTARLVQGIPNDISVMVGHIRDFLEKYVEFQEPRYADKIEEMGERMRSDKEKFKMQALEILKEGSSVTGDDGRKPEELGHHPPLFETFVGPAHFVLPTYCNPLMTCFYSLLFVCYAGFQQQDIDQSIPSGQFL